MKEDILEQIVEAYLNKLGYFTRANVKFKPDANDSGYNKRQDSVPSDLDVIGYHPSKSGADRVVVVSCKSWQVGFEPSSELKAIRENKSHAGRERWRAFRELANDKWAKACKRVTKELTGADEFEHWTACLFVKKPNEAALWIEEPSFQKRLTSHLRIITLKEMLAHLAVDMTTTVASSQVGRLVQVMKAAGFEFK